MQQRTTQPDIGASQLRFTVIDQAPTGQSTLKTSGRPIRDISDDIFRKSINCSAIGKISGNNALAERFEKEGHSLN